VRSRGRIEEVVPSRYQFEDLWKEVSRSLMEKETAWSISMEKILSDSKEESVPAERKQERKTAGRKETRREKERNEGNEPQIHVSADNNNNLHTPKKEKQTNSQGKKDPATHIVYPTPHAQARK
jgi:hypothetical protein